MTPAFVSDRDRELIRSAALLGEAQLDAEVFRRVSAVRAQRGSCATAAVASSLTRPVSRRAWDIGLTPVRLSSLYNSDYPRDENNGALWAGKGLSAALEAGVHVRLGPLTAAAVPVATFSANGAFALGTTLGVSEFGAAWTSGIDLPQRFGDASLHRLEPGQSYARIDLAGFAAGIATENLWWGPQRFFPVVMSSAGAGFPHFFFGTSRPVDIWIGHISGELVWARLSESEFFDADSTNDKRLFGGLVVGFQPKPLPGLTIGASRINHQFEESELDFVDLLRAPYANVYENRDDNQMLSVFARWAFVGAGLEIFGEWGRDDHWFNNDDLVREIDHTQVYSLGFQQVIARPAEWLRIYGELAHLGASGTYRGGRGAPTFYTNGQIPQGHTERGQMLGAWIGPGSDGQIIGVDRLRATGEAGVFLQRTRYNSDAYYAIWSNQFVDSGHDVELTAGGHWSKRLGNFEYEAGGSLSRRWNRAFVSLGRGETAAEWNVNLKLTATWRP